VEVKPTPATVKPTPATVEPTPATVEPTPATVEPTPATVEAVAASVRRDPRIAALPDIHGHAKGEHKAFAEERPIPYTARMLFLWFFHACRRSSPRFLMVADHMNYLTFEDPAAVNLVRRALKLAQAGDLYGAAETAGVELGHAAVVSEGLRRGMRYSIGAEIDNDPRCRPDAQNIVDAMKPDGMIRSIHFLAITHPQHGEHWMWAFDNPEFKDLYDVVGAASVWETYMTTLLEAIDKLPGNIVGHFYVPAKFGHWPEEDVLESYEDRFVAACAERGMAIEVNSRYFYKYYVGDDAQVARYRSAHVRLLRKAKAANVMIAVGSDAHSPKDQGRAFETVLELLDEAEINEIAFPIAGRLARVALRATEETLRQHAAPAPAAVPAAPKVAVPTVEAPSVAQRDTSAPRPTRARPKPPVSPSAAAGPAAASDPVAADGTGGPAPKKRSHKKGAAGHAPLEAVGTPPETVTAVPAKAVAAVAEALTAADTELADTKPADTKPAGEEPASLKPDEATRDARKPEARKRPGARRAAPAATPARNNPSARATGAKPADGGRVVAPKGKTTAKATPAKAAATKSSPKSRTAKAAAAKASRSQPAAKKSAKRSPAKTAVRPAAAKKPASKSAPRSAKKAPAKRAAPVKKALAKPAKRPAPAKAAASKKSSAKKTATKKKTARARR